MDEKYSFKPEPFPTDAEQCLRELGKPSAEKCCTPEEPAMDAARKIVAILQPLSPFGKQRVLRTVCAFFYISIDPKA
jgi:hypothetical protein